MISFSSCPKRPVVIENVYNFMQKTHCINCNLICEVWISSTGEDKRDNGVWETVLWGS